MGTQSRVYLKNKWVSGYKPTQSDYDEFFDSFYNVSDDVMPRQIGCSIDGLGSGIVADQVGFSALFYNGTISNWTIVGDVTGDVVFDILKNGTSIIGSGTKPEIVSGTTNTGDSSDWDLSSVSDGDIIEYVIESVSSFKKLSLFLKITP